MSLWDIAKKAGSMALDATQQSVNEKRRRINRYREKFQSYSDKELLEKYRVGSFEEKMACKYIFKERGWGEDEADSDRDY